MRYALIVEDDIKVVQEITTMLTELEPQATVVALSDLHALKDWLIQQIDAAAIDIPLQVKAFETKSAARAAALAASGAPASPAATASATPTSAGGAAKAVAPPPSTPGLPTGFRPELKCEIGMVFVKAEFFSKRFTGLLRRTRDFLVRRYLSHADNQTKVFVLATDAERNNAQSCADDSIANVFYKPLDKAWTAQSIAIAIAGEKPAASDYLYKQQASIKIEALKGALSVRLSDYGFTTYSDRALQIGEIAKYHNPLFNSKDQMGVYGRCRGVLEDSRTPGQFLCQFSFFGMSPDQVSKVRKYLREQPKSKIHPSFPVPKVSGPPKKKSVIPPRNILIVEPDDARTNLLREFLQRNFPNVKLHTYKDYFTFLMDVDPQLSIELQGGKKSKPILPNGVSHDWTFHRETKVLTKSNPEILDTLEVAGLTFGFFLKSETALKSKIESTDWPRLEALFGKAAKVGDGCQVRISLPDGSREYLEFKLKQSVDASGHLTMSVRELGAEEKAASLKKNRPFATPIHGIILSQKHFAENLPGRWEQFITSLKRGGIGVSAGVLPPVFMMLDRPAHVINVEPFVLPHMCGVIGEPFDRNHFLELLALYIDGLDASVVKAQMTYVEMPMKLKAARYVVTTEVSESGVGIRYNRAIQPGEFRSFFLPSPHAEDIVELLGRCQSSVEAEETDGEFVSSFVFFGLTDVHLKYVRNWLHFTYVESKDEEAA